MFNSKKMFLTWFGILCLGNAIAYSVVHLDYLYEPKALSYLAKYVTWAWEFIYPVICLAIILTAFSRTGKKTSALLGGLLLSSARFTYYSLYYYLHFVIDGGFSTGEAIFLSALNTPASILTTYSQVLILFVLSILVAVIIRKKRGRTDDTLSSILEKGQNAGSFDFGSTPTVCIFLSSIWQLIFYLSSEIYDTVEFLGKNFNTVNLPELLTMVFNYLFILVMFLTAHTICVKIMNMLPDKFGLKGEIENGETGI